MNPEIHDITQLTPSDRDGMHGLLTRCFSGVTREGFDADLANKTQAVLLRDPDSKIAGFTTLAFYIAPGPDGKPVTVVCSGDTLVAPEAWGTSALPRAWIRAALAWHATHGTGTLHWLLICSGFRTYRFLPVFFERFFPHHEHPTPTSTAAWMQQLAARRYGHAYDPATGIVRLDTPQQLRGGLAQIPAAKLRDPHVAHFLAQNPGHADGDELVCVCALDDDNLTRAGRRMVHARAAEPAT